MLIIPILRKWILIFFVSALLITRPVGATIDPSSIYSPYPVVVDGQEIFLLKAGVGSISAEERSQIIVERVLRVAHDDMLSVENITVNPVGDSLEIVGGQHVLLVISEMDAVAENRSIASLAQQRLDELKRAVRLYRQERSTQNIGINIGYLVLLTGGLWWLWRGVKRLIVYWRTCWIKGEGTVYQYVVKMKRYQIISAEQLDIAINRILTGSYWLSGAVILYIYLHIALRIFPETRQYANQILEYGMKPLNFVTATLIDYLPNFSIILLILIMSRYSLKVINAFFNQIKVGNVQITGFYVEWAEPSYKIVRLLLLSLALICIFPYLPGAQSPAFQSVTVFLGILFSLGSTSVVANMVAGTTLTYTRAFAMGDRVKIGEHVGDIVEKNMLATRIRTIKNVDITIPNALVLNNSIINYSTQDSQGLILNTQVTIGYDVSWRKVHELLINAAMVTPDILKVPEPFVLQMSLDDFYVTYEINAYTKKPNRMAIIYSDLHQKIQDMFNSANIEIMSPHYTALRDGEKTTVSQRGNNAIQS